MVHIVFKKNDTEEVIYGIYIEVPEEVKALLETQPVVYRVLPYRLKEEAESPFAG